MRPSPAWFFALTMLASTTAGAQAPPASPAPPAYAQPQPYGPPYAPPTPYYGPSYPQPYPYPPYTPTKYQAPEVLPYRAGAPVPVGYHIEEVPRRGLVTSGWILVAIPYVIGVTAALSANFKNESGWLGVPFVGPWLTIGRRNYHCDRDNTTGQERLDCTADIFVVMGLIMSGMMQAGGATLLSIGYLNPKQQLRRDDAKLRIMPSRVGSGQGLGVSGSF